MTKKQEKDIKMGSEVVKLVSQTKFDDKYLVYEVENKGNVYLLSEQDVQFTTEEQSISRTVLADANQPYMWTQEIKNYLVSIDDVRIALLRSGLLEKTELDFKEFLAQLFQMGLLPIKE